MSGLNERERMASADELSITSRLTRLETLIEVKFADVIQRLDQSHADHELRLRQLERDEPDPVVADHENRLRRVEQMIWRASGAAVVLGGGVGAIASLFLGR